MVGILYNSITPALGETPSYKMLAIIVLGGLGNPVGTVIAGLFVGLSETLISVYIGSFIPKDSIAFICTGVDTAYQALRLSEQKTLVKEGME